MGVRRSLRKWARKRYFLSRISLLDTPMEYYVGKMMNGEVFSFSRYNDGEWNAILDKKGSNIDGHEYFPELGARLRESIHQPLKYIYAFGDKAMTLDGITIARYLKDHGINITWYNCNVFHDTNMKGELYPLIAQLRKMQIVMVGPDHLRGLGEKVFAYQHFIEVPSRNCFLKVDQIKEEVLEYARSRKNLLFSFSASMAAKVLIYELYPLIGDRHWLIDFGSLWDIYVGVKSRGVHSEFDWGPILKKNLGALSH